MTQTILQGGVPAVQTGGVEANQFLYLDVKEDLFKESKAVWVRQIVIGMGETPAWSVLQSDRSIEG